MIRSHSCTLNKLSARVDNNKVESTKTILSTSNSSNFSQKKLSKHYDVRKKPQLLKVLEPGIRSANLWWSCGLSTQVPNHHTGCRWSRCGGPAGGGRGFRNGRSGEFFGTPRADKSHPGVNLYKTVTHEKCRKKNIVSLFSSPTSRLCLQQHPGPNDMHS